MFVRSIRACNANDECVDAMANTCNADGQGCDALDAGNNYDGVDQCLATQFWYVQRMLNWFVACWLRIFDERGSITHNKKPRASQRRRVRSMPGTVAAAGQRVSDRPTFPLRVRSLRAEWCVCLFVFACFCGLRWLRRDFCLFCSSCRHVGQIRLLVCVALNQADAIDR